MNKRQKFDGRESAYIVRAVVVAIGVKENTETVEVVFAAENWTELVLVPSVPHHEAVAVQLVFAVPMNAELELYLPICHVNWLKK